MSWISNLYETYNNCQSEIGLERDDDKLLLLPVGHTTQNAQIEVVLDEQGNFQRASKVDKPGTTVIPCTEDSASRSGAAEFPHPLFDKLQYVAGDYRKYGGVKGKDSFNIYIKQLEHWCQSENSHPKVKAVLTYLQKERLIEDLIFHKILDYDEKEKLFNDPAQLDSFVRFRVQIAGDPESALWLDQSVRNCYIRYYANIQEDTDVCYVTGQQMPVTEKHSKKIRNSGDSTKLISSNDSSGFTFRGRFTDRKQVVSIGYETSQKAHNALRWLISKQGYINGDQVVIAWGTKNPDIPTIWDDSFSILEDDETTTFVSTEQAYADWLSKRMSGYGKFIDHHSKITVMGLDSATPGRLSIFYYRELFANEYIEKVQDWFESCVWRHYYAIGKEKKSTDFIGTPIPKDIALAAYGFRADSKLVAETIERLLPCIFDGKSLPRDLVVSSVRRASNPQTMEKYEWNKTLSIACALYKKLHQKEGLSMSLDNSITDRSYLYGRLLAVADKLESMTYERGENRQTNAMRYMSKFAQDPLRTWDIIWKRLTPYIAKSGGKSYRYQNLVSEITSKFEYDDYSKKGSLDGKYLLGFHCQRQVFLDEAKERKQKELLENQSES